MANAIIDLYKKYLADTGQTDDRTDYEITAELGQWAAQNNPKLFDTFQDFGQEYGAIREANAPSLGAEFGRAIKSGSQGLASTALGGLSLLTGSDYLRDKAQSFEQDAAENAPTIPTIEDITPGRSGIGSLFSKDAARYAVSKLGSVAPSIGEAVVTGAAGAALGSAVAPGPGTVAGAAEGIVARGLVKSAIKSLIRKGVAEDLVARGVIAEASEPALEQAVKSGVKAATEKVGLEAMAIGAKRGMAATNLANSYLLNAGDVYSEGGSRPTAMALGLISAIPDSVLPTFVLGRLFPGVSAAKAMPLAKQYIGDRAIKALEAAGLVGTEAATEYFQEAVNVVARNIKEGKDALAFSDADRKRFREAGIAGAFGGGIAAPSILINPAQNAVTEADQVKRAPQANLASNISAISNNEIGSVPDTAGIETPIDTAIKANQLVPTDIIPNELAAIQESRQQVATEQDEAQQAEAAQLLTEQQAAINQRINTPKTPAPTPDALGRAMVGETPEMAAERKGQQAAFAMAGATVPDASSEQQALERLGTQMMGTATKPTPANVPLSPIQAKIKQVTEAIKVPGIRYQYSVFPIDMIGPGKDRTQIDIISSTGENLTSTNLGQLAELGVKLPTVPDALPMGKYTPEQVTASQLPVEVAVKAASEPAPIPDAVVPDVSVPVTTDKLELVSPFYKLKAPKPLTESIGTVDDALAYRKERIDNYRNVLKSEIGINDAQAERLQSLLRRDADTTRFERSLTPNQREKLEAFFDGPLNQKGGPLEDWNEGTRDMEALAESTDKAELADVVVGSLGRIGNAPEFSASDAFLSPVIALHRLREIGGSWRDVDLAIKNKLTSMRAGNDSTELYAAYGRSIKQFADNNGLSLPLDASTTPSIASTSAFPQTTLIASESSAPPAPINLTTLSESRLVSLAKQLGIDTKKMSGDRLRARIESNARPENIAIAIATPADVIPEFRQDSTPSAQDSHATNAINATKASQFNTVLANLEQLGMNIQLFSREMLAQNTAEILQQRISALQQESQQATDPLVKIELDRRIGVLNERAQAVDQATGVTYSPWQIALAAEDIGNASANNLVTLLHEAAESLTMRMTVAQQGAVRTAINQALESVRQRAEQASQQTGVPLAQETSPADLLAETLAQELTAQDIPEAPSLAQAIIRWVKDAYYRTAMALQAAFGGDPNPDTALAWFENQLRREVYGDFDYELASLLDRYLPSPLQERVRRFNGRSGTPGGISDFLDPVSGIVRQPQVEALNRDALNWDMQFQIPGNPGEELAIPDPEARARIKGGVINGLREFYEQLKAEIAPNAQWDDFFQQIKRTSEEDPRLLIEELNQKFPGAGDAKIGGDGMTEPMNREAQVELWSRLRKLSLSLRRQSAQAQKSIDTASKEFTEEADTINNLEADLRNASLHEDQLRQRAKALVKELTQSINRGRSTAHIQGGLAEAIREAENLREEDPIPTRYQNALKRLYDGETPIFDYIRAIAELDLPLTEMTSKEVLAAIKSGADTNTTLAQLDANRPLAVALTTLARKNASQVDQIQLGWLRDTGAYRDIHENLEKIKTATTQQLRELSQKIDSRGKAAGLASRIQASYIAKRRRQQQLSARITRAEERQSLLEKAFDPVDRRTEEAAQAAGGAQYEWTPEEGAKWTAMRQNEEGNWSRTERVLQFNPDGSAVDGDQLRKDIASNLTWLRDRAADVGKPRYNQIAAQTYALQLLDAKGQQQRTWNGVILNGIDRFVRTPIATARSLGGPAMQRIIQMLNKYQFILRSYQKTLEAPSTQWQYEFTKLRKSSGLTDNGEFISQVYKPAMYFLSVNPGLDESAAIRQAAQLVRRGLQKPAEDFNERFSAFLKKTKETEENLLSIAEQYGVFVADKRLGPELRRAVARGWLTGMRSLNGGLVDVLTKDMAKSGWKADTFGAFDPANAANEEQANAIYAALSNPEIITPVINKLFTPSVVNQWLEPFIRKPGQEPFAYQGEPIPQALVQEAWNESGGDVLGWIDRLATKVGVLPDKQSHDPVALFRLSMMRNLNSLFNHEVKLAADASQTPGLLDPHGVKPHALMDARVSDLLPPEHVDFATYEPENMHRLLARVAYAGAFGRNAKNIQSAFRETMNYLKGRQSEFQTLASLHTSKEGRIAEAKARGWNYDELETAARRYREAEDFQTQIESLIGVSANSGPLGDFTKGMAILNFMSGQIVDNPKTAAYNLLSPAMRPFAQRSLGPTSISNTVKTYADILHTGLGSVFGSFGLHLLKAGKYAQTIGNAEGRAFSNLPFGVVLSDIGHSGDNQEGANKWLVKPIKIARNLQRKGIQLGSGESTEFPRLSLIPGMGVMNTLSQIETQASGARLAQEFEQIVKNGIDYMQSHPDAATNPSFRFKASDLYRFKLDHPLFDWWRQKTVEYNLGNLEDVVRDAAKRQADDPQARLITDDQALTMSMMNQNEFSGNSSINTTPAWLMTNPFLRLAMPLMRWPLWMMSAVHEASKPRQGENWQKPMLRAIGTMALWNLPIGLAFSLLMDEYDKRLIGRKSNLPNLDKVAALPLVGLPLSLLTSDKPLSQLESMLVRSARAGNIYGLGADVAAQTLAGLDPSTGQRAFSLDQRVLAMSQFLNLQQAIRNWTSQGFPTWGSVGRPLMMAMGGNGVLHSVDITNNLLGLDNAQSRLVQRTASSSWIRSAAQELDIPIKSGGGFGGVPTPLSAHTREMYLAALANDRASFLESYRRALDTAREHVAEDPDIRSTDREQEAQKRVIASWRSRNPMAVLATAPTESQIRQMLSIMDPQGQESVREAMDRFTRFGEMIAPSQAERYMQRQLSSQRRQFDPEALRKRMTGGSLLFSTR